MYTLSHKDHQKKVVTPRHDPGLQQGFTLVEMLVVVVIITLLGGIVMLSVYDSTRNANRATAEAEIKDIATAIIRLAGDTGKFPNGCPAGAVNNPEIDLNQPAAGLVSPPPEGETYPGSDSHEVCAWRTEDVARWNGPYYDGELTDPWGHAYWFDPDYAPYRECDEEAQLPTIPAVVSGGPNGNGTVGAINSYDCDNIHLELR
ncbi:MAG: prepilin-type N-terminal cleavage/methylation domain-containing protein [Patescibacteria group bacterium]